MARIVVASWMVRYPLGGNLSWTLQWLLGFARLGHDVCMLEKSGWADACFDPVRGVMSDDCATGTRIVDDLLRRFGLANRWCYVDQAGQYHGMNREQVREILAAADVLIDLGSHGAWMEEAANVPVRVLVDGEPGFNQMKMQQRLDAGESLPDYTHWYSNGANVGTAAFAGPTAGRAWRPVFNPVVVDLFDGAAPPRDGMFTTVMNWKAHADFVYDGRRFGQKDVAFEAFIDLPRRAAETMEIAVTRGAPREALEEHGWRLQNARTVTRSFDSYVNYIRGSAGEFSVAKHGYVATCSGWFSDRSAAYLAAGRPVIMQDTGFSAHLPCGKGLFAVRDCDEAADAIAQVRADPRMHNEAARRIAREHLDTSIVLRRLLREVGCEQHALTPARP